MEKPEVLMIGGGPDWYIARYAAAFTLHRIPKPDPTALDPELAARVRAVIAAAPVPAAIIAALPKLAIIANTGAGYEKIDVAAARARGIVVVNTPGVTDGCVADMAMGLLLAAARHIVRGDKYARSGAWSKAAYPLVPRVFGKRMGILGLGHIGMTIARRAAAFDMKISYYSRRPRADVSYPYLPSVAALAAASDFLVVACPGGPATRHIVDAEVLKALGPKGYVVNISRGSVIDEEALIAALEDGTIAGAGLDVLEHEPAVPARLAALDNVVIMPHRGGGTIETWEEVTELVNANLAAFFAGKPPLTPIPE